MGLPPDHRPSRSALRKDPPMDVRQFANPAGKLRITLDEPTFRAGACIKVIGVGGGGGNAVHRMVGASLGDVEFIVANTDQQALASNAAPVKLQIGAQRTKGLGAGADPEVCVIEAALSPRFVR